MAEHASPPAMLAPPAVTALREQGSQSQGNRTMMERTVSMDIREEREDLKRAAEQSMNAIMELGLDGRIGWMSPSWQELTGVSASEVVGQDIADLIVDSPSIFTECIEAMRKDDSKSHIVRFTTEKTRLSGPLDLPFADGMTPVEEDEVPAMEHFEGHTPRTEDVAQPKEEGSASELNQEAAGGEEDKTVDLEAQGIMVYDRTSGQESHTMWMIKPAVTRQISLDLPEDLINSLGVGAEILAQYLTSLADVGLRDPGNHPPPLPVLCRICERQITPWWFERHSELCLEEHRAERDVQDAQEALQEQRSLLVKVLDALEMQSRGSRSGFTSPEPGAPPTVQRAEYKGLPIGSTSVPSSGPSSGRSSPAIAPSRSRESSTSGLSHHRARSFAVRRPLARIVELVLDLCDTAMEISTPSIKDTKAYAPGELRTQSPQSESRIQQVLQWQSPGTSSLENEQGLALLCDETSQLARGKVEHVLRHRQILEYSERVRVEFDVMVQECIEMTIQKAARIAAGELSDSSEDSANYDTPEQGYESAAESLRGGDTLQPDDSFLATSMRFSASPSAMAMALRDMSDTNLSRRISSPSSSIASSPRGATTPKSHVFPSESFSFHKRGSIALESDTGAESDSSMRSSAPSMSTSYRRAHSPGADVTLSRALSTTRSRERKRHSLVLSNLTSGTPRHASPARGPPPPSSPLRIAKPRIPSEANSIPSPIISPVLSHSDFNSPVLRAQVHHHRRQSSNALSDALGRPASPRLSAVISNPQPRAVQTSIKDFEVIKPISKGAFGSVYLAKKKSTGDYYAIKVLKKADMVAKNQVNNVKAERHIMMWQGESDFVAKLYWTFSSKDYLYLVMEYLNGGDCASLIKVLGALPEDWTKKYIGEVVLCVQHLHSRAIVHRDLKPDNLLIDAKGHLKLTDFGLSRMGLIGRQKRAINAKPGDAPPDLLKSGPFRRAPSVTSSRSTSFDYHGGHNSPQQTPAMTPALLGELSQPSYFSLNRDSSREPSRRTSGQRSNSGDSEALDIAYRRFSVTDGRTPIEEETRSEGGGNGGGDSPDPYMLQPVSSQSSAPKAETPPQSSAIMPPPAMALFDPEDSNRRFVGTPDYLAPETISGAGQDEMSDWWSLGCILFECLYGRPPFSADTPEEVFQNILDRKIQWPVDDEEDMVSEEAKDLMNRLMCSDPKDRLGSNKDEQYDDGGEEIKAHPWFSDINWDTLREDEASFVPISENPEDTEYFDARGATMPIFAPEFQDESASPGITPGAEYDRPHDALSRVRSQVNAVKRNLMPLHIPPHVRDGRSRRLSEPIGTDDFGNFQFKNLQVLEKANKDVIQKLRADALQAQAKSSTGPTASSTPSIASPSPAPSLESSPVLAVPLHRTKSHGRPRSPSVFNHQSSSPNRSSQPSSPMLVSFNSGGPSHQDRRKASGAASSLSHQTSHSGLNSPALLDQPARLPTTLKSVSSAASPVKGAKASPGQTVQADGSRQLSVNSPRQRSHTVGSQEGDLVPDLMQRHKRRSAVFDVSPSSSDNEESRHQKALLRVQRRRQSSRRLSQISLADGPSFRTLDVLVCEDHPVSRLVMERLLEKLRCRTIAVTNGSEAMRYAMSEVKFDVIMMEYKLPQVNGADVARMIRDTRNANSHTPIVAVTGYLKELHAPHHFDALVEKPPTKEKLEEVMGRLCQWRAPPPGWKPSLNQANAPSSLRQESTNIGDSPTTASSDYTRYSHDASLRGSSREESVTSTSISEADSHYDSIPVIISRQATLDWDASELERNFGGLGISSPDQEKRSPFSHPIPLQHSESAPPVMEGADFPAPRRRPSSEAIRAKRHALDRGPLESAADSGDDEDEEFGNAFVRQRSPKRHVKRTSKLGTEMMRTNSQGSVVSNEDLPVKKAWSGPDDPPICEQPANVVEACGQLTPPEHFPPRAGRQRDEAQGAPEVRTPATSHPADMSDFDPDATPRPQNKGESDPDPTPRASITPMHAD